MTHFCFADWILSCLVSRLKTIYDMFDIVDVNTEDEKVSKGLKQDCGCNERGRRQPQETF